jgi:glycosyltransferase involved in cell wall biosynthesis
MTRLGVAIQDTWSFFNEIYADMQKHYEVSTFRQRTLNSPFFRERINARLFRHDLRQFLKKNDVVFFEWASELLVAASQQPKVCGIVTRIHRYEMYRWVDKIDWKAVDRIIVVSEAKRKEFSDRFPDHAAKLVMIPEATSLEKFAPRPRTFGGNIGILGNLTPRKRVYELILTFYELRQKRENLHLHIGGGIRGAFRDYYYALQYLVRDLKLEEHVTFYGNVSNPAEWFHNIDIYVSNSYSEGLQVSPMEAMASGCYCLAHRWSGADELLSEEYLFYTEAELQRKIEQYCDMPEQERQEHKCRMRDTVVKNFDLNQTIVRINNVIDEVVASAEGRFGKK